jgi:hypothetical protein
MTRMPLMRSNGAAAHVLPCGARFVAALATDSCVRREAAARRDFVLEQDIRRRARARHPPDRKRPDVGQDPSEAVIAEIFV